MVKLKPLGKRAMPDVRSGKRTETKGTCTNINMNKLTEESEVTTSETDGTWKSPSKLKQEVQTIIDIMGPPLGSKFNYNTSSEADNEESIFSNSKLSSEKYDEKRCCPCDNQSEKSESDDIPSKEETNLSTAADVNTTISATMEDLTDSKVNFPYVDNICGNNQYICPPPLMPANVCINSECFCPQMASILHSKNILQHTNSNERKSGEVPANVCNCLERRSNVNSCSKTGGGSKNMFTNWLRAMVSSSKWADVASGGSMQDYYKMNVKKNRGDDNSPPRRVVFELVEGLPKNAESCNTTCDPDPVETKTKKNVKNQRLQTKVDVCCDFENIDNRKVKKPVEKTTYNDSSGTTRVDVYYFDHGSFNHYQTTDAPPHVTTEEIADKTEKHTTRFWAEIFGSIHVGFSFVTSFVLQFFRFVLYSLCRPLTIGLIQLASDYFFKPLLATAFNGVIQPILIFLYNILASLRDICDPIAEGIGYFYRELAVLVRSFRIVEVNIDHCKSQNECKCDRKGRRSKI